MAITFRSIDELPEVLQEYLYSDVVTTITQEVFATYGIEDRARQDAVLDALWAVFHGTLTLERLPHRLGEGLGKAPDATYSMAAELAVRILLPARDYLGPVESYVRRWDETAATKEYGSVGQSFTLPAYTREELIEEIVALRPATITHPRAVANFEKLAEEMVYRGRTNFEEVVYLSDLVGSVDGSGVGMPAAVAESTLLQIKQLMAGSSTAKSAPPQTTQRPAAAQARRQSVSEDKQMAKEVAAHAREMPTTPVSSADAAFVDQITASVLAKFPTLNAQTARAAIDARVRDVRDTAATMEFLMRSAEQGGAGVDADTAMQIITILEQQVSERSQAQRAAVTPTVATQPAQPQSQPRAVIAPRAPEPTPIAQPTPPPPRPIVAEKPRVEDVRRIIAPTGPIQEIASMRLVDFRRSSQDSMERVTKILGAMERIGEEAYDEKIQAIQAWRYNEPYQLYEDMVVDALQNRKPLSVLIQERVRDRQPVLEVKEVSALLHMHRMMENW